VRIGFHPEAAAEFRAAALWYEERRAHLGDEFVEAVIALSQRIRCRAHELCNVARPVPAGFADSPRLGGSVPYALAFEVQAEDILILAVAHAKRRPLYWLGRVRHEPVQQAPEPTAVGQ